MEYFEYWNIGENGIFVNTEYLESSKVKRTIFLQVTEPILHILECRIFKNIEFLKYRIFSKVEYS